MHLGYTRCTNAFSGTSIGVKWKEQTMQHRSRHTEISWPGTCSKQSLVLLCILCEWPNARLHPGRWDVKRSLRKFKEDICHTQEIAVKTGAEQHLTEIYVGGWLHLQGKGDMKLAWFYQPDGWWGRDGVGLPRRTGIDIWIISNEEKVEEVGPESWEVYNHWLLRWTKGS